MNTTKESLGQVTLQRFGGSAGETCDVVRTSRGLRLLDRHGVTIASGSNRLGFSGKNGTFGAVLVRDTIPADAARELRAAGFPIVDHCSQAEGSPILREGSRLTIGQIEALDNSDMWC